MRLDILLAVLVAITASNSVSAQTTEQCAEGETCAATSAPVFEAKLPKGANAQGLPEKVSFDHCVDRHPRCAEFANEWGECEKNPGWMIVNCANSCNACHLRDPRVRCSRETLNTTHTLAYQPGDMEAMFSSLEERFSDIYGITIVSTDPWVVTFDNFVSDEEIENILGSVHDKWERSTDTGAMNEFGEAGRILSEGRTSSNAWCRQECESNPFVQNVYRKISEVTGIHRDNYESFQILQYDRNQRYTTHHDSSESDNEIPCGPRILTFFLYLSNVEEGGETAFPELGITVKPKKGMGLLWPSTLDSDPSQIDHRTVHEAKRVIKGKKFAANAWIHLYDFEKANKWGCTGAFD